MKKLTAAMTVWMAMLDGPFADASAAPIFADDFNRRRAGGAVRVR